MLRQLCAAGVCLIACCACLAQTGEQLTLPADQWSPPHLNIPDSLPPPTDGPLMIRSIRLGDMHIALGKTTRPEVQHHFGGATGARGDASDYEVWLCYRGKDSVGRWALWFVGGEVDGPAVGYFQWRRLLPGEQLDTRCKSLPDKDQPKLPLGLTLDMPEAKARAILGKPSLKLGPVRIYLHAQQEIIHQLPYTTENLVTLEVEDGVVRAIQASSATTD